MGSAYICLLIERSSFSVYMYMYVSGVVGPYTCWVCESQEALNLVVFDEVYVLAIVSNG